MKWPIFDSSLGKNSSVISGLGLFCILCVIVAGGCQSPEGYNLEIKTAEELRYTKTKDDVILSIQPWTHGDEIKKHFKADLLGKKILPLQIAIENRSDQTARFSSTQAELTFSGLGGQKVISESEMARRTHKNTATGPMLVYIGTLGLGAPISLMMANDLNKENLNARSSRSKNHFSIVTIDPGEVMSGFLFFDIPKEVKLSKKAPVAADFVVRRLSKSMGGYWAFNIPLEIQKQ